MQSGGSFARAQGSVSSVEPGFANNRSFTALNRNAGPPFAPILATISESRAGLAVKVSHQE